MARRGLGLWLAAQCAFALIGAVPARAQPDDNRLDPALKLLQRAQRERLAGQSRTGAAAQGRPSPEQLAERLAGRARRTGASGTAAPAAPVLNLVLGFAGDSGALRAAGFEVDARLGSVVTGRLRPERLTQLLRVPGLRSAQLSREMRAFPARLRAGEAGTAPPESAALPLPPQSGGDGSGVLVAFVDTGVDIFHNDFRTSGGATRIRYLLDLSDPGDVDGDGDLDGDGPFGGTLYAEAEINAALSLSGSVRQKDTTGHGTHGLSIAAGDDDGGSAPGLAPGADLIVVKATRVDGTLSFTSADILNALAFVDQKATELGAPGPARPFVVNLSLGTLFSSHDGRSLEEQAIDALVGPGRPGKAVVIAAGNSSENRASRFHHFQGTAFVGLETSHGLSVPGYTPAPGKGNDRILIDLWYDGRDRHSVIVRPPSGCGPVEVAAAYGDFADVSTSCGDVFIANMGGANPSNGDTEALVLIDDWSGNAPADGEWSVAVRGEQSGGSGRYHGWLADESEVGGQEPFLSTNADNLYLVAKPGGAYNGITVGSYALHSAGTRFLTEWDDVSTPSPVHRIDASAVPGDISDFSSPGGTRDGRIKPDLAAPGERVKGAVSRDAYPGVAPNSVYRFHPFGFAAALITDAASPERTFGVLQGTSFAAPVVSGLVARLLSVDPTLDAIQLRNILINTAAADSLTGAVPNPHWGYGKVDTTVAASGTGPLPGNLRIDDAALPATSLGKQYSHVLTASGGALPYAWSLGSGSSLPPGLILTAGGLLTGSATAPGSFTFTLQVGDATTPTPQLAQRGFTIEVNSQPALSIVSSLLPAGRVDRAYEEVLLAEGGTPPYSWGVVGGSLPAGLSLLGNGVLQGTPGELGRFDFTVEAQDSFGASARRSFRIKVVGASGEDWDPLGKTTPIVNQIAIDPTDPARAFVSTRNIDAVFETTTGGDSWRATSINNNFNSYASRLVMDPFGAPWAIRDAACAGTTELFRFERATDRWLSANLFANLRALDFDATGTAYAAASNPPSVYRSTDQGTSWATLGSVGPDLCAGSRDLSIFRLDPQNQQLVTQGSTHISEDGGISWTDTTNLTGGGGSIRVSQRDALDVIKTSGSTVYHSIDGGRNWAAFALPASTTALDRAASEPEVALVGTTGGLFKSSNGGQTWLPLPVKGTQQQIDSVAIDPANADNYYVGTATGLFRSSDGGLTWSLKSSGLVRRVLNAVEVSASHPTDVMISASEGPYTSRTGGATWTLSREGLGNAPPKKIAISAVNADLAYLVSDDGFFRTENRGVTWSEPDASFGTGFLFTAIDADPFDSGTAVVAFSGTHGVYRTSNRGQTWSGVNAGLPFNEPTDLSFARDAAGRLYASFLSKGVYRSENRGTSWSAFGLNTITVNEVEPAPTNSEYVYARAGSTVYFRDPGAGGTFVAASAGPARPLNDIVVDPNDPLTAYGGADHPGVAGAAGGVYKTVDGGRNWARVPGILDAFDVVALAAHSTLSGTLYAATSNAGVYRTSDGGVTWTELGNYGTVADLTRVTLEDPSNSNLLFAGTEGYGVQVSTDKGRTFVPRVNGLGNLYVNALAFDPEQSSTLYAGTEAGVYKTTNSGTTWTLTGLASGNVSDLVTDNPGGLGRDIWATVMGQGVAYSPNGGTSFTVYSSGLDSLSLTSVEINHKGTGRDIWATMRGGSGVALSRDLGQTWLSAAGNGLTDRNVNDLAIGTGRDIWATGRDIWATTDTGVYYTTDDGLTWTQLSVGLPSSVPVTSVAVDPSSSEVLVSLFSDTEGGVYRGGNLDGVWKPFNGGLGELKVRKLTRAGGRNLDPNTIATTFFASTAGDGVYASDVLSKNSNPVLIMTAALPDAVTRQGYVHTLVVQGGQPPYGWAVSQGALPPGLSLDPDTGTLSGQPSSVGLYAFTLQVSDGFARTDRREFSLRVHGDPAITIADVTLAEGDTGTTTANFAVSLSAASTDTVTVEYVTANGTATAGSDYAAASGTLTFTPGQTLLQVEVSVAGDATAEPDETFFLQLRNAVGASLARAQGTATIRDEEQTQPALSIADVAVAEGDSGSRSATFSVRLASPSARQITVHYATSDGSAAAGSDYVATSGDLTFAPGVTERTLQVTVQGDTLEELAAETFLVTLSGPVNASLGRAQATGRIVSEEVVPELRFEAEAEEIFEGNSGSTDFLLNVVLSKAAAQQVTVAYATADGSAQAGSDYTSTSGTLTFAPGETTKTIVVPVLGDVVPDALLETFSVVLSNPANATLVTTQFQATIRDDEVFPRLSINPASLPEGTAGTTPLILLVTLEPAALDEVTVAYATSPGTATEGTDYVAASGILTFAPGVTEQEVVVTVNGDMVAESWETFFFTLSNPTNALFTSAQATVQIENSVPPQLQILGREYYGSFLESNDTTVDFIVTLSGAHTSEVTVAYTTSDGSAEAGSDYTTTAGTLTFPPGTGTRTIQVPIVSDGVREPRIETFVVTLQDPTGALLQDAEATGEIEDDEPLPTISLGGVVNPLEDDGSVSIEVQLSETSIQEVTVDYATSDGSAKAGSDYVAAAGTLTFQPGESTRTISVTLVADQIAESAEQFFVTLTNPSPGYLVALNNGVLSIDIYDEQPAPDLAVADATAREPEAGAAQASFVVTMGQASSLTVTVDYATIDATASAGSDYAALSGTLTFAPGVTSLTVSVPVLADDERESVESFRLRLSNPTNVYLLREEASGVIHEAALPVVVSEVSVTEPDTGAASAAFEVTLARPSERPVFVEYATADGTARAGIDYESRQGTLVFLPGETAHTVEVPVLGNTHDDPERAFTLSVSQRPQTCCALAFASSGGLAFVARIGPNGVAGPLGIVAVAGGPLAVDPQGHRLYASGGGGVAVYTIQDGGADLVAIPGSPFPGGGGRALAIDPAGRFVYAADQTNLSAFAVDLMTGALTPVPGSPFALNGTLANLFGTYSNRPIAVAGPFVYVALTNGIAGFQVDQQTGALAALPPTTLDADLKAWELGSPHAGRFLYATLSGGNYLDKYAIDGATGALDRIERRATSGEPGGLAVDRDGRYVYVATSSPNGVTRYDEVRPGVNPPVFQAGPNREFAPEFLRIPFESLSPLLQPLEGFLAASPIGFADTVFLFNQLSDGGFSLLSGTDLPISPSHGAVSQFPDPLNLAAATGTARILDDDALTVAIGDVTVSEGAPNAVFSVSLATAPADEVRVDFQTADGTATAPEDYQSTSGTLVFAPGERVRTVSVPITMPDDAADQLDRSFFVNLSNPLNAAIGDGQGVATLVNNDTRVISIDSPTAPEGNSGPAAAMFTVSLSAPSVRTITVDFTTQPGTAQPGLDYQATAGTLTFEPGATAKPVTVPILGNTVDDSDRAFRVLLSNPTNALIASRQGPLDARWTRRGPAAPVARNYARTAYDASTDRLIAFGGVGASGATNSAWVLENALAADATSRWRQLSPAGSGPGIKVTHAAVHDAGSNRLIVHGGSESDGSPVLAARETWVLTGANGLGASEWIRLPDHPGNPRHFVTAAYDVASNRMIAFGGQVADVGLVNEVWVLKDANGLGSPEWVQLLPEGSAPQARRGEAVYDQGSNRLIVFGGDVGDPAPKNDLYVLTNANGLGGVPVWIRMAPEGTTPAPRAFHSMSYDPQTNQLYVFGGWKGYFGSVIGHQALGDGWLLTNANGLGGTPRWVPIPTPGPAARYGSGAARGGTASLIVLQGGNPRENVNAFDDLWVLEDVLPGTATIADDDAAPTVSVNDVSVAEGNSGLATATFTLTLSGPSARQVDVSFATADGSARSGPDYVATGGNATIPPGAVSATFSVSVQGDVFLEGSETFYVNLTSASNAGIGDGQGLGTIQNDDAPSSDHPVPHLDAIDPLAAAPGGPGFELRLIGANFLPESKVRWNGSDRTTTFVTTRELRASIGAADVAASGTARVSVFTPAPGGGGSTTLPLVIHSPASSVSFTRATLAAPSGGQPIFVAAADLNGDGHADLVTANTAADNVSVFLGNGNGTFSARADYPAGDSPRSIHVADLDNDGSPDLAVANSGSGSVSVLPGNGDGSFAPRVDYAAGVGALLTVVAADFNGDGRLDLAAGGTAGFSTLLRNSDGSYLSPGYVTDAGRSFSMLVAADFNGDGRLDLLGSATAPNGTGAGVMLFAGNGEGAFTIPSVSDYCCYDRRIAAADFNRDGALDYIRAQYFGSDAAIAFGTNTGSFAGGPGSPIIPSAYFPAIADFNADGVIDSAWTNVNHHTFWLMPGSGNYAFENPVEFATGTSPYGAAAADFDGDGRMDLATANAGSDSVSVFTNVPPPTLSIDDVTVTEGNIGQIVDANFTVTLSAPSIATVTVGYATADGTALAGGDYVARNGTLSFAPGETTKVIPVTYIGDATYEASETFFVNLTAPSGATLADAQASGTLTNDEPGFILSVSDATVAEDASQATFTVSMPEPVATGQTVTVNYTTADGTAAAGADYVAKSGTLTLDGGQSSATITVTLLPDGVDESNETFTMNLSSPSGAVIVDPQGVATIADDDDSVVSIGDRTLTEGNSGLQNASFTVTLSAPSARPVEVGYTSADDTARAGPDFIATSGTLTFAPGETSRTIEVPVRGDVFLEADETFFVNLLAAPGLGIGDGQGLGSILNDDVASSDAPVPALHAIDPVSTAPGSAGFELRVLGANLLPTSVVRWNGTPRTTTFVSARELRAAITASDVASAGVAQVSVSSPGPGGGHSESAAFVVSQPTMLVSFTRSDVVTGNGPVFVAAGDVNGDGKADLVVANQDDDAVSVRLGNGDGSFAAPSDYAAGDGPGGLALADLDRDGDLDLVVVNRNAGTASVLLGNGAGGFAARSDYDAGTEPSRVAAADFNADGKLDLAVGYAGPTSVAVLLGNGDGTFIPGYASGPAGIGVTSLAHADFNGDGRLDLLLGALERGVFALTGNNEGVFTHSNIQTSNCCYPFPALTADFNHDGALDVLWTQGESNNGVIVALGNNAGGFPADTGSPGIPATSFGLSADFNADGVLDSAWSNGGQASVSIVLGSGSYGFRQPTPFATGSGPSAAAAADFNGDGRIDLAVANSAADSVSILINAPPPSLTVANVAVNEGNQLQTNAVFTVTLSPPSVATVTVNYATADDTAISGSDYTATSGTLTFQPGETSKTVSVVVFGDLGFEPDETFLVNLGSANGADVADAQGQGAILNDDTGFALSVGDVSVVEGDSGTPNVVFTVSMPIVVPAGQSVSVGYTTVFGSAGDSVDYLGVAGTLTFNEGESTKTVAVTLIPDLLDEPNETLTLNLSNPAGALIVDGQGVATIVDDDAAPALSVADAAAAEGQPPGTTDLVFMVTLSLPSGRPVTVAYAAANGTAQSGVDFEPLSGVLTFAPGETARLLTVKLSRDSQSEGDETLLLDVSNPVNASLARAQGVGTILDDDARVKAAMTSPATGSTIGPITTFSWSSGSNVSEYWLFVGTSLGGFDVFNGSQGTARSRTLAGLPEGTTIFVRLLSLLGAVWESNDYSYRVSTGPALSVTKLGNGGGVVTTNPAGIDCGAICGAGFLLNQLVTLNALPDADSIFSGWGGVCSSSGSGPCQVTMDASKSATATFTKKTFGLSISKLGPGGGAIASNPLGLDCGGSCTAEFDIHTVVTLTAIADSASVFRRWGGACSGSAACQVTMDAARSVTATFDKKPAKSDLSGDGKSDIVWRKVGAGVDKGAVFLWTMDGTGLAGSRYLDPISEEWQVQATGDFNGDGKADVLWRNTNASSTDAGKLFIWIMDGPNVVGGTGYTASQADLGWRVEGVSDLNGDGKDDIVWRKTGAGVDKGALFLWTMDGTSLLGARYLDPISEDWQVQFTGDFNGDGKGDVLWRSFGSGPDAGKLYIWIMDGPNVVGGTGYTASQADLGWRVDGVGDLNGDGKADIVWRKTGAGVDKGALFLWTMDGTGISNARYLDPISEDWQVQGLGDFNGDGKSDVLWRNFAAGPDNGKLYLWMMDGPNVAAGTGYTAAQADLGWVVAAPR